MAIYHKNNKPFLLSGFYNNLNQDKKLKKEKLSNYWNDKDINFFNFNNYGKIKEINIKEKIIEYPIKENKIKKIDIPLIKINLNELSGHIIEYFYEFNNNLLSELIFCYYFDIEKYRYFYINKNQWKNLFKKYPEIQTSILCEWDNSMWNVIKIYNIELYVLICIKNNI